MKWFQHWTDSHTNKKGRKILRNQGLEGYAIWWICREMIGKEGKSYRLSASDEWKKTLIEVSGKDNGMIEKILAYHAEIGAISHNALKKGDLYIPKMKEYSDDYAKRIRRMSEQSSVRLDKTTLDKIRVEYVKLKGWNEKDLMPDDYARIYKAIKALLLKAKTDERALQAINWVAKQGYDNWTMETVVKKFPDAIIPICPKCKGKGRFTNIKGYDQPCDCPKGKLLEKEKPYNPRL